MRITPALLLIVLGCSGGKHPKDPHKAERDAARKQREALEAERPKRPYETRERIAFRPGDRCGQGPYRIETESLRAKYGEQVVVYACGLHHISGNYRFTVERKGRDSKPEDQAFGFAGRENEACKANRAQAAQTASGAGGGGGGAGGGSPSKAGGTGGGTVAAPPATLKPTALERGAEVPPEGCEQVRTWVLDTTYTADSDWVPLDGHLAIDLWSNEPNDFEGLVFVVEKYAVVADMTVERWKAYRQAENEWSERYNAFVKGEVTAGRSHWLDTTAKTPPPPAPRAEVQPPKPSKNARWIPGYWQYDKASFHWIVGLWEVPDEDIQKDLTVHAPSPPPPPQVEEPKEARPTATAVWAPGQWQWDGRAYVWIAGSWRIPPSEQHTWQPATWAVKAGGAVFVPGGWHVNVKIRR